MNSTVKKKKVNFTNLSENEGLFPPCISLFFHGFGSVSKLSFWILSARTPFSHFAFEIQAFSI
jgi:hypothetical protein